MDLSADQFREHLEEFQQRTGMEVGHNAVTHRGRQLSAVGHHMHIYRGGHEGRAIKTWVPTEQGNLHLLWGHTMGGGPDPRHDDAVFFSGRSHHPTKVDQPMAMYSSSLGDDPYVGVSAFHERLSEMMRDTPMPSAEIRQENAARLRMHGEQSGLMRVHLQYGGRGEHSRFYQYNLNNQEFGPAP